MKSLKSPQMLVLGLITIISQPLFAQNNFPTTKQFDISEVVTKQALSCDNLENLDPVLEFYLPFYDTKRDMPKLNGKP